jgi:hypothetical protein
MPAPPIDTTVPGWQRQAEFQRPCKKCGAQLFFIRSKQSDKLIPYTESGISHFLDCPFADDFSKSKAAAAPAPPAPPPAPPQPKPAPQQAGLFGPTSATRYGVD